MHNTAFLHLPDYEIIRKLKFSAYSDIEEEIYEWLKIKLEQTLKIRFPELPKAGTTANWDELLNAWFFETSPAFLNATWQGDKIIFNSNSAFSRDIANSPSFSGSRTGNSIKRKFFEVSDVARPNPFEASFHFVGSETGIKDYYSVVEWFLGSYKTKIYWFKSNNSYAIKALVSNRSHWYSGTRLPKSWQNKLDETLGFSIENLVDSAPRGQTIKRKLPIFISNKLESEFNFSLPSFGGDLRQEFNIETIWIK
ncbi:hypothetical protein [Flavobacterium sp. H122]|uniref:hypothetical protein n=1 Tax=Flavobacterium sp. H122 TaxID=2529860 RepID=UPI0010A9FA33|nr:hypothetical protein [Flavobacterium sp. H122]